MALQRCGYQVYGLHSQDPLGQEKYIAIMVKNISTIRTWLINMSDSMISYIEQVDTEIWKIYKHGMVLIVDSRCFNISRLIMKWTEEKDSSEYELR